MGTVLCITSESPDLSSETVKKDQDFRTVTIGVDR